MENNDRSLAKALDTAMSKQSVTGLLCTDENGLLVAVKGDLDGDLAGRLSSISKLASSLSPDNSVPTVVIETTGHQIVIKDYDALTIALKCEK